MVLKLMFPFEVHYNLFIFLSRSRTIYHTLTRGERAVKGDGHRINDDKKGGNDKYDKDGDNDDYDVRRWG